MISKAIKGLSAAQVKGTASVLRADALGYSPAVGLMALQANAIVLNLLHSTPPIDTSMYGAAPARLLARELFFQRDASEYPMPTRSRARAAFFLTPERLGHLVGLAVLDRGDDALEEALRSCDVVARSTPQGRRMVVDGVATNVSLSRLRRIFGLAKETYVESPYGLAMPLLMRFLWQRAESKADLLSYLLALDSHIPIFAEGHEALRYDSAAQQTWLRLEYTQLELRCQRAPEAAALLLLGEKASSGGPSFGSEGDAAELVAASLSSAHASKPAIQLRHHGFRGAPPKPDCAEVACREVIDLLLWDPSLPGYFDTSRLPSTASPALASFYVRERRRLDAGCDGDGHRGEAEASQHWFELVSGIQGVSYLCSSGCRDGTADYELRPTLASVSGALGALLFGDPTLKRLSEVASQVACIHMR